MSFGVAAADPVDLLEIPRGDIGPAADRLIRRADSALFAAKEAGRDRVAVVDVDGLLVDQPAADPPAIAPLGGRREPRTPAERREEPEGVEEPAEPESRSETLRVRPVARVGADGRVRAVELARTTG